MTPEQINKALRGLLKEIESRSDIGARCNLAKGGIIALIGATEPEPYCGKTTGPK